MMIYDDDALLHYDEIIMMLSALSVEFACGRQVTTIEFVMWTTTICREKLQRLRTAINDKPVDT